MGTINLLGKAGPCVHLIKGTLTNPEEDFYIPYWDFPSINTRQELRQPIKELYQEFIDILSDKQGWVGTTAKAAITVLDIFGIQIASKNFYAQSWKGGVPTAFTLNLKFFRGITGGEGNKWSAQNEVYNPIMVLIGQTIPVQTGTFITAPVPSSANVFANFTSQFIKDVIAGTVGLINGAVPGSVSTEIPGARTWTMEFGYQDSHSVFISFFKFVNTIIESSTFQFSPMVEVSNNGIFPISGTVTLSCKTQSILTTSDFNNQPVAPNTSGG